jgi:4-amino-4-deoxy-L-arabinose transferase-like glycosyltransferase
MTPLTHAPSNPANRLHVSPARARCEVVVHPTDAPPHRPFSHALTAGLLIAAWVVLNIAYLVFDCPLDLAPDEAHYWHWSRHLDWSYYSKGPLVAWLIRGSCELFGGLSVRLVGSEMLAVRLPAVVASAALLAGLYVLAAGTLRSSRAGLAVVAVAYTLPGVTAAAVVMTIDPPFLACWCWALAGAWKAVERGRVGWWLLAGGCSALGVLAKYPMLLLPLAVVGFLLANRRAEFRRPGFWVFVALTLFGGLPVLVWNAAHDWVSLRHVLGQAGVGVNAKGFRWLGPVEFAAGQFGVLLGFWFAAVAAGAWRRRRTGDVGLSLLWWATVPVWGVFFLASFFAAGQVNWPAAAYVGGIVLAAAWLRDRLDSRLVVGGLAGAILLGLGLSLGLRYPVLVRPLLAALAGPPTEENPTPLRKFDPTCRLRGWRTLAAAVDRTRDRVTRETGEAPVLAGMVWTTPGELAFYCRGHPEAYSFGLALADRHSQYDVWRPNPVADAQVFRGRSFVYVGDEIPAAAAVFERMEPPVRVIHSENGVPVAAWTVWVGHGFRGFPPPAARPGY